MIGNKIVADGISYEIIKLIGKGQAGYSYLSKADENYFVVKIFDDDNNLIDNILNKFNQEIEAYYILFDIGIPIPKLIYKDNKEHYLIKEYIDGNTLAQIIGKRLFKEKHIIQILKMCEKVYRRNLNLDYFPTNFVEKNNVLYYIDYGCGKYTDDWNFENNGIYFYANTSGIEKFLEDGNYGALVENGKPIKTGFEGIVKNWLSLKQIL